MGGHNIARDGRLMGKQPGSKRFDSSLAKPGVSCYHRRESVGKLIAPNYAFFILWHRGDAVYVEPWTRLGRYFRCEESSPAGRDDERARPGGNRSAPGRPACATTARGGTDDQHACPGSSFRAPAGKPCRASCRKGRRGNRRWRFGGGQKPDGGHVLFRPESGIAAVCEGRRSRRDQKASSASSRR